LLPDCVDDYLVEASPVRVVDIFVDELDLAALGFEGAAATGRPGYHPTILLKLYIYGYLNPVQSSRWLEREAGRNVELMWLMGKLAPDFKPVLSLSKGRSPTSAAIVAPPSRRRAGASSCSAAISA
jgi:transposase